MASPDDHGTGTARIRGVVPMLHVADVERSATFYAVLGFAVGNAVPAEAPHEWVWMYTPHAADWKSGANLMLTRSSRPIAAEAQEVLFYLYAEDLPGARAALLAAGIQAGEIGYPEYLPQGEFRVQDPDGYTLMLAQSTRETP